MATEIIARDTIAVTNFEYRIARVEREGANQQIQVRFVRKDATVGEWENANMGHYQSRASALDNFLARYGTIGADFTPLDPGLKEKFAKRNREASLIEKGRLKAGAQAKIDRVNEEERRNLIREEFKKATFKTESVDLRGPSGVIGTQRVPTIGGLAITVAGTRNKKKVYGLTHQGTGFAIGPDDFETQGEAKLAAFRLTQLTDFTQDQKALQATGIPFSSIANTFRRDSLADISDRLPARPTPILESQPIAKPKDIDNRRRIAELKASQETRAKEIARRTPTGKELLETSPPALTDKFLLPGSAGAERTTFQSNRLIETALNAAAAADPIAQSNEARSIDIVDSLFGRMTKEEQQSFLAVLPPAQIPFWQRSKRFRIANTTTTSKRPKVLKAAVLPARTADTMSEAIAMSSPSGRQSKTSKKAAEERLRISLFGPGGLQRSGVPQPSEAEGLRRRSKELRELAGRGMSPRKFKKEAALLDAKAEILERPRVRAQVGISNRAALARFNNPRAGVGKGNKRRNPVADARVTALVVAPARATNAKDVKLQQRWFKHPGRLDFQGVDTGPRKSFRGRRTP